MFLGNIEIRHFVFKVSMFGRASGGAHTPDWPRRHRIPLLGIIMSGLRHGKKRMLWGRQLFCPHFFSATQVCGWCDYTLPLFRILGLGVVLAARCLQSRPAWIIFFFRCWVANGKEVAWWGLALGAGSWRLWPSLPLLHYLHLAAHCQSDKSGHLVPSLCAFQQKRDQSF